MKIAITPEDILEREASIVSLLISAGWDMVHLRHPNASLTDMRKLIEGIPMRYHKKLRLHGHFELLNHFNLGGVHLNCRNPKPPTNWRGAISKSIHNIEELANDKRRYDYVTLSPVFNSISKEGYTAAVDIEKFIKQKPEIDTKIIALGGVTGNRVSEIKKYGFDGYAVLGALFKNLEDEEMFIKRMKQFE